MSKINLNTENVVSVLLAVVLTLGLVFSASSGDPRTFEKVIYTTE